jgi:hypothetical protein
MPIVKGSGSAGIVGPWAKPGARMPTIPFLAPRRYRISGITRNSTGAVLGGCTVDVFDTRTRVLQGTVVSDATTGEYSLDVSAERDVSDGSTQPPQFFVVAYLDGAPDVAGTSVNTLVGA